MDFILEMARDAKVDFIRVLNRCHFEYSLVGPWFSIPLSKLSTSSNHLAPLFGKGGEEKKTGSETEKDPILHLHLFREHRSGKVK